MNWSQSDLAQFANLEIGQDQVEKQVNSFKQGFPSAKLNRAATVGDGILQFSVEEQELFIAQFTKLSKKLRSTKFTPASGAASRMFKHLFAALEGNDSELSDAFLSDIESFAFYTELVETLKDKKLDISNASNKDILDAVLNNSLNYGSKPKAMIAFHAFNNEVRLAIEEHFLEGAKYGVSRDKKCLLHFTVSPEHLNMVKAECDKLQKKYELEFGISYEVSFSYQLASTNTIAVTLDNAPYRQDDGSLLFRPGGHGALIQNLNELDADLIFVKNIDNVCVPTKQEATWRWKQILGGFLLNTSELVKRYIIDNDDAAKQELHKLGLPSIASDEDLKQMLDRPIRVCGMVKNQGEPGGGPFWVNQTDGVPTLQIVEKAQIDTSNKNQADILSEATHFNPVDLVCYTKDAKGNAFDLVDFIDSDTGFIAEKSVNGKTVKALELPGLWNGAMAHWLTFFVEVPLETFNPVKTVNDLLKPFHQS